MSENIGTLDGPPEASQEADEWADDIDARAALVGAVLWVAAAALCVIATFQDLYSASLGGVTDLHVNGWGTVTQQGHAGTGHASRFGIVLCVNAGLFLVAAAVMYASTRADRRQLVRAGRALGIAATAFLVGSLLSMGMVIESAFDAVTTEENADQVDKAFAANVQTSIGWLIWLGVIALICSAIAFAAPALGRLGQAIGGSGAQSDNDG